MGGGDLNLKKSWHPQTLKNVERVWKAEQKHEAERKKIEELQRELREERAREEIQRYAEETGAVKKRDEKLDWMYQGPGALVNREEYLLGRPVDKYVMEKMEEVEAGPSSETGLLPGSIFTATGANSALDMASKIREDPLFIIRKREEEKKREVLSNPVKMKKIKQLLQHNLDKREKKKKKKKEKKKKHKHRHRSPSIHNSDSEHERPREKSRKKSENSLTASSHQKLTGYGLLIRDADSSSQKPDSSLHHHHHHQRVQHKHRQRSRSRSRSPSPRRHSHKSSKHSEPRDPRNRLASVSPPRHGKQLRDKTDRNTTGEIVRGPSPKKETYQRRHDTTHTRKLTAQELEQRRREMMENAKWREEERVANIQRYKKEEEKERDVEKRDTRDGKFIHNLKLQSAASSSLEDRVKRNIHSIQRTTAALEKSFMKR
ncbi:pre-mRNA-splicing factor CWC25 homolog isoform X2 [Latimeria chalumnae]|uniref:pre-mRNA-splicing factor CWC25 homolog isoform X2 n=1 Tax=Latimeria chalumnae TaxID=7897 RepID=UPI00313B46C5